MRALVIAVIGLVSGCFDPVFPDTYQCDCDRPACPPEFVCDFDRGCCHRSGSSCVSFADLSIPADFSISPDLSEPSECANGGGIRLAAGVWACLGKFASGGAASLCRHRLGNSQLPKSVVDECNRHFGFWVIPDQEFAVNNKSGTCLAPETQTCQWSAGVTVSYRLGCGQYKCASYRDCATFCGAWAQALSCFSNYSGYTCVDHTRNQFNDINLDSNIGVICQQ